MRRRPPRFAHSLPRARLRRRSHSRSAVCVATRRLWRSDMRPPRKALASTGSTAGGAFLRVSQTSIAPSKRPPSIGPPNAASGRDALGGAEVNVEGNAENPHMRDVDDAGHHGDAQAGDARRRRSRARSCRIRSRANAHGRSRAQSAPGAVRRRADVGRASPYSTYARRAPPCQGRGVARRRSASEKRHVVAMDHFCASGDP